MRYADFPHRLSCAQDEHSQRLASPGIDTIEKKSAEKDYMEKQEKPMQESCKGFCRSATRLRLQRRSPPV